MKFSAQFLTIFLLFIKFVCRSYYYVYNITLVNENIFSIYNKEKINVYNTFFLNSISIVKMEWLQFF